MTERRKNERMKRQKDKMKKKKTERQRGVEVGHIVLDDLNGPGSRVKKKIPILTIFGVPNYASQIP